MSDASTLQIALATAIISAASVWLLAAALVAGVHRVLDTRVNQLQPRRRARLLLIACLLPGALAVLVLFAQALTGLGHPLVHDHCHHGIGCAAHAPQISALGGLAVTALALALLGIALVRVAWAVRQHVQLTARLEVIANSDAASAATAPGGHEFTALETDHPGAFAVGLIRPRVWVTRGVQQALSAQEFAAVLAHEQAHVIRRDALREWLARLLLPPIFTARLQRALALANEQSADAQAAAGDPYRPARALIALERLQGQRASAEATAMAILQKHVPSHAANTASHALEQRIGALLAPGSGQRTYRLLLIGLTIAAALTALAGADVMHVLSERLFHHAP